MTYTITHVGAWISWNSLLTLNRWQRQKLLDAWVPIYQQMFRDAQVQPMTFFRVDVRYWSRADCDNCVIKRLVDTPDATLKHNPYVITITDLGTGVLS